MKTDAQDVYQPILAVVGRAVVSTLIKYFKSKYNIEASFKTIYFTHAHPTVKPSDKADILFRFVTFNPKSKPFSVALLSNQ